MEKADDDSSKTQTSETRASSPTPPLKNAPIFCCHGSGPGGRNLIVCIDGTANQFGSKNTNVIELYSLILKEGADQLTWYNSGIGTYARPSWRSFKYVRKVIDHKIDLIIAWNFERTILAAYRWLSENYMKGDRIFLYGFSRGAFQVRVLSAMIEKVGLIHKGNEEQIPFAYELYADPKSAEPTSVPAVSERVPKKLPFLKRLVKRFTRKGKVTPIAVAEGESMAERFKRTFSHKDVKVHFVGVWDTVSSIGIVRGKCMLPGTIDGMKHVCFFRHALALDERRVKFSPEYAYGGSATDPADLELSARIHPADSEKHRTSRTRLWRKSDTSTPSVIRAPSTGHTTSFPAANNNSNTVYSHSESPPHTLEVWFAGTHSDIGGGNAYNAAMDRSRPPLRWMVFESGTSGLRTKLFNRPLSPKEQIEVEESLTWHWRMIELFPLRRLTYTRRLDGKQTTHKPHLGSPRKIHVGQKIHGSLLRTDQNYIPKALPPDDERDLWITARRTGLRGWQAVDLYEATQDIVNNSARADTSTDGWESLQQTVLTSGDGRQAVYEGVMNTLLGPSLNTDDKHRLITKAMEILPCSTQEHALKLYPYSDVAETITELMKNKKNTKNRDNLRTFVNGYVEPRSIVELRGHANPISSVAISPSGKHIISGSRDNTLRVWDSEMRTPVGDPLRGHTNWVRSVAISPNGKLIASGSDDNTVRIWDATTHEPVGNPFEGHTDWIWSVAFSPDSKHVASASRDHTIRIWNVEPGKCGVELLQLLLVGHTDAVNTIAYTPDGKYLASGSSDRTVRIWNVHTGQPAGEVLHGHTSHVTAVAFSPDGTRIASGSRDGTVRIWDVETRKPIGEPFADHHTGWILSVAFSPDGRRIVSTSDDGGYTLVWIVETRKKEHTFQHDGVVFSAAFTPDGQSVVSGCEDGVVRVWDAESWY